MLMPYSMTLVAQVESNPPRRGPNDNVKSRLAAQDAHCARGSPLRKRPAEAEASVDLAFGRHGDDVGVNVLRRVENCTVVVQK
jgi:hypothetical protein